MFHTFHGDFNGDNTINIADLNNPDYDIKMYPNPTSDHLSFSLGHNDVIKAYQIYDITGKKVMHNSKVEKRSIEVSKLTKGFYFIKIKTNRGELSGKFIKK